MENGFTRDGVKSILERLRESVEREECSSCDCLRGLITQLELDAAEDVSDLTAPLKIAREDTHGCLGCEPCPPGALFAEYVRGLVKA